MSNYNFIVKTSNLQKWNEDVATDNIITEGIDGGDSASDLAKIMSEREDTTAFFCVITHYDKGSGEFIDVLGSAFINGNEVIPYNVHAELLGKLTISTQENNTFFGWTDYIAGAFLDWDTEKIADATDLSIMEEIVDYLVLADKTRFANDILILQVLDDYVKLLGMDHISDIRLPDNSNATWLTDREEWSNRLSSVFDVAMSYGRTRDEVAEMLRDVSVNLYRSYDMPLRITPVVLGFQNTETIVLRFIRFLPGLQDDDGIFETSVDIKALPKIIKSYIKDFYAFSKQEESDEFRMLKEEHRPILSVLVDLNAVATEGLGFEGWQIAE